MSCTQEIHSGCPYRSRHGAIFGVCKGLAGYFNVSVFWTRFIVVVAFLMTGFWPVGAAYLVAALLMKQGPVAECESEDDREFYSSYSGAPELGLGRLKRTFDSLDRRIQRMENVVTSKSYDWDKRLFNS